MIGRGGGGDGGFIAVAVVQSWRFASLCKVCA